MLNPEDVSLAESALLVIDVQDSFRAAPRWERRSNPAFEEIEERTAYALRRRFARIVRAAELAGELRALTAGGTRLAGARPRAAGAAPRARP
jgi:hypothetical protein